MFRDCNLTDITPEYDTETRPCTTTRQTVLITPSVKATVFVNGLSNKLVSTVVSLVRSQFCLVTKGHAMRLLSLTRDRNIVSRCPTSSTI